MPGMPWHGLEDLVPTSVQSFIQPLGHKHAFRGKQKWHLAAPYSVVCAHVASLLFSLKLSGLMPRGRVSLKS